MLIYLQTIESPAEKSLFETIYLEYRGLLMREAKSFLKDNSLAEALNVRGIPFFMIYDNTKCEEHHYTKPKTK